MAIGVVASQPDSDLNTELEASSSDAEMDLVDSNGNLFGRAGSWRWALYAGAGFDVNEDAENYDLHYSASKFFTSVAS